MARRPARWRISAAAAALLIVILGGCSGQNLMPDHTSHTSSRPTESSRQLANLPAESFATPPAMRLGKGVIPPTNRWFSGLVFPSQPQTVFPSPLSYKPLSDGFEIGVPVVASNADTIAGGAIGDLKISLGSDNFTVTGYDDASVTMSLTAHGHDLAHVTLAEGSPVLSLRGAADAAMHVDAAAWQESGSQWHAHGVSGRDYVVRAEKAETQANGGRLNLQLHHGSTVTLAALPDHASDQTIRTIAQAAAITDVHLDYGISGNSAQTTLRYKTDNAAQTIVTAMPHQGNGCSNPIGTYPTVYGTARACVANSLTWSVPLITANDQLNLDHLSAEDKDYLIAQIKRDTGNVREDYYDDTYTGGKALQRNAALMLLAEAMGQKQEAADLRGTLTQQLRRWTTADSCKSATERCFAFDSIQRMVIGKKVAYGSETANDVHFHLGYFLSAAAMVGAGDSALVKDMAPVINTLATTLASDTTSQNGTRLRTFDSYWSHSWASGWAPFADGNNQESSSEAINAWNGLALWARVIPNTTPETRAEWMLSNEIASARAYWTNFNTSDPAYRGYKHSIVSLNWGGKRDYATWFSADPSAKLGILVLPASPVSSYLSGDSSRIRANVAAAIGTSHDYNVVFGDYMLMYRSLAGRQDAQDALDVARALPQNRIDNGNTRSYMIAYIMSRARS